jgi:chromosome segregation protein
MLLKRLKISGFKSFAEKTEFLFDEGLTALVGPNGCGKSNLVDAVKWLLGEQSPKSLRAREMADLIYNGGSSERALGFAEATLALSLNGHDGQAEDGNGEVLITRRVYPSGEGEYLLNNAPCRLKDIRELLMDTGLGVTTYSVIEQGRVDFLLSAGPQERRIILDEAAGINKFKQRKKQTLAKLERVETNLLRLGDVIQEVHRQLRSIKYQAGRARTYQRLKTLLRTMQLTWGLHNYHALYDEKKAREQKLSSLQKKRLSLEAEAKKIAERRTFLEAQVSSVRSETAHLAREEVNLKARESSLSEQITFNEKRIEELNQEMEKLQGSQAHIRKRLEELEVQISDETKALLSLEEEKKENEQALQDSRGNYQEIVSRLEELKLHLATRKNQVVEIASVLAKLQNRKAVLTNQEESQSPRLKRLKTKASEVRGQLEVILSRKNALEGQQGELQRQDKSLEQALKEMKSELSAAENALAEIAQKCARNLRLSESLSSQCELLRNLISHREGVSAGAVAVLEASSQGGLQGIKGLLADFVSVPQAFALAVEAALEYFQEYVVTETRKAALAALNFTCKKNHRAAFIPLDAFKCSPVAGNHPTTDGERRRASSARLGFPVPLFSVVEAEEMARPAVEYLLEGFFLVENLAQAEALRANGYACHILVTLNGEVVKPPGIVAGGKQGTGGLIMRSSRLTDFEERLSVLARERVILEEEKEKKASELERMREKAVALEAKRQELSEKLAQCRNEISRVALSEETLSDEMEVSRLETEEAEAELKRLRLEAKALASEISQKSEDKSQEEQKVASFEEEIREKEEESVRLRSLVAKLEVTISEGEKRLGAARALVGELRRNSAERSQELSAAQEEGGRARDKITRTRSEIEAKRALLAQVRQECGQTQAELSRLQQRENTLAASLEETSSAQDEMNTSVTQVSQDISREQLAHKETCVKMANWEERIEEEYSEKLSQLHCCFLSSVTSLAAPTQKKAAAQAGQQADNLTEDNEDDAPFDLSTLASPETDWLAYKEEMDQLRKKISRLGNVNLEALSQEEELQQRADFLTSQEADLKKARTELLEVISRINRTSREMFLATFSAVRENFQEIFRKLFGGGRADIFLVDENDVLESDVEIVARPPGKEVKSITLLSGGESVLAAMALFFAILKAKPAPFCILDEVDAALDEANTVRFLLVLEEFLKGTQFIIITHNKRTMSRAGALYGITMQKKGISKRIAVKFQGKAA